MHPIVFPAVRLVNFFVLAAHVGRKSGVAWRTPSGRKIQTRVVPASSSSKSLSLSLSLLRSDPFTMASTTTTRRNIHRQQTPYLCKRGATFANDNANFYAPATAPKNNANANANAQKSHPRKTGRSPENE
jgi:hypothetical protein